MYEVQRGEGSTTLVEFLDHCGAEEEKDKDKDKGDYQSSTKRDTDTVVIDDESIEPKPRELWTNEEIKRFRLDAQARNIIIRSIPHSVQFKFGVVILRMRLGISLKRVVQAKTKENKLEALNLSSIT